MYQQLLFIWGVILVAPTNSVYDQENVLKYLQLTVLWAEYSAEILCSDEMAPSEMHCMCCELFSHVFNGW